jgi:hypothetical protein
MRAAAKYIFGWVSSSCTSAKIVLVFGRATDTKVWLQASRIRFGSKPPASEALGMLAAFQAGGEEWSGFCRLNP